MGISEYDALYAERIQDPQILTNGTEYVAKDLSPYGLPVLPKQLGYAILLFIRPSGIDEIQCQPWLIDPKYALEMRSDGGLHKYVSKEISEVHKKDKKLSFNPSGRVTDYSWFSYAWPADGDAYPNPVFATAYMFPKPQHDRRFPEKLRAVVDATQKGAVLEGHDIYADRYHIHNGALTQISEY